MKDVDGSIVAGARLSDLEELVARLPQGAQTTTSCLKAMAL